MTSLSGSLEQRLLEQTEDAPGADAWSNSNPDVQADSLPQSMTTGPNARTSGTAACAYDSSTQEEAQEIGHQRVIWAHC